MVDDRISTATAANPGSQKGPLAAILILVGLIFGSANLAGAAPSVHDSSARQGMERTKAAAPIARSQGRDLATERLPGSDPVVRAFEASIVTETLNARPGDPGSGERVSSAPLRAGTFYRARAPPAD